MKTTWMLAGAAATALIASTPALADDHASGDTTELTAPKIEYTMWTLDNGLRVIAIPDDTTSTVTTSLWYDIGSKLDPEGRSGFAHLFEHILSRKTENMPYNMIYGLTADIGGTRNASNWVDRTNYFEQVPAAYLETMLWTHRERMANVVVDTEVFETERGVVKEELRQRVLAPPYGRLQRFVIPENVYDTMPHRRPGIGSIEDLDSATLDDARAFYEAYYGPDTATLIVAGNFEMGNLRGLVDEYFADIAPRSNPVDLAIAEREPEITQPREVNATAPNVPLPVVGAVWKAPPVTDPDAAALEVMEAILVRGENSRLDNALVRSGQAVQAAASVLMFREAGQIATYAVVSGEDKMEQATSTLDSEIERIRSEAVTAAELAEAKSEIVASTLRRRETARGRAFELGEALVSSGDPEFADKRLGEITSVTAEDVMRVAAKYLDPQKRVAITYTSGEDDAFSYANPTPMPEFRTLPPATGEIREVKPEGERMAPPGPGATPDVAAPEIVEGTLSNGIKVVAVQTGEVPIATISMLFPGGSKTDQRAKAGIAQMAAGLADKGVLGADAQSIAAKFESLGASFGGGAGSDGTSFSLTAPVANLGEAGDMAARIVRYATYPQEEFNRERDRAVNGLRVSMKEPGGLSRFITRVVMYGDAPYGTQPGGTSESLAAITRDDLVAHREAYFHPDAMQIVVSGGISPELAMETAEAMFGDWAVDTPAADVPAEAAGDPQPVRTIVVDMPDAGQAAVIAAVRAPSRTGEDFYALELANSVMGGGSSGRLFEEVRTKRSLSYGAYSGFADRIDESILQASAQTKNETADEVAKIFLDEFARLGSEPLSDDLLAKRRLFMSGANARRLETSGGFNGTVSTLLQQGLEPSEAVKFAERLESVDADAASAAARTYVDPAKATLVIVGDAKQFIDDLRALRDNVEVIPADSLYLESADLMKAEAASDPAP
ncbi:pitrilysin family protein [Erythrobacter sp. F6033]|uniref:M16 family metallopeptidase n=1 Tax=Erythrobacter sp. F6033 TaxID=2926401 RepID=UPI001FF2EAAD|nr:pitrilysin family protein [Erythrobacter sp. F6033]MCK0129301.1 insulinase family protein [Erythrobacter sp. F6033]